MSEGLLGGAEGNLSGRMMWLHRKDEPIVGHCHNKGHTLFVFTGGFGICPMEFREPTKENIKICRDNRHKTDINPDGLLLTPVMERVKYREALLQKPEDWDEDGDPVRKIMLHEIPYLFVPAGVYHSVWATHNNTTGMCTFAHYHMDGTPSQTYTGAERFYQ